MTTVLLTGASGFVGRQVMAALLARNVNVKPILRTGKEAPCYESIDAKSIIWSDDIFAQQDEWWNQHLTGIDTIIHCAWYAEPGQYLQSAKNLACMHGTMRMATAAARNGVTRFVGIGTCFEYDVDKGFLDVDTPLRPQNLYASTKAATYLVLNQLFKLHSVSFSWARLFYLFGEGEDPRRLFPFVHERLQRGLEVELTEGTQIRDYLDVKEAGDQIVQLALSSHQGPVNICSGIPQTVRQICESIADQYGLRHLLKFGKRPPNTTDPPCVVGVRASPNNHHLDPIH